MSEDDYDAIVILDPRTGQERRFDSNSSSTELWQLTRPTSEYYYQLSEQQRAKAQELYEDYLRRHISVNLDGGEPYADRDVDVRKEDLDMLKELAREPEAWCISKEDQEKLNWSIRKREKELKEMDKDGTAYSRAALNRLEKAEPPMDSEEGKLLEQLKNYYRQQIEDIKAGRDPLQREVDEMEREEHKPLRFHTVTPQGRSQDYTELGKDSDLNDLKKVKTDYERGESYCTYNMRYDDYKRLTDWIRGKEPQPPKSKFPLDKRDQRPLSSSEVLIRQNEFEKACRNFEEGDKVIVFAEGKRGYSYFTEVFTNDSDLDLLKEAFERTSPESYEGSNPAAALPEEKAQMLSDWIIEKEREKPELTKVEGLTPESDYLRLAAYLSRDDEKRTPEEYWTVNKWAEKQKEIFLNDLEKQDEKAGRKDIVRGVIFDQVEEVHKDQELEHLRFVNDTLEMTENHRERLKQWIDERERPKAKDEPKTPSHLTQDMDAPIKFEKAGDFDRHKQAREKQYDVIDKDTDLSQLKQVASDYETGKSYCTKNMSYDDYYRLNGWIKERELYKPTTLRFKEAEKQQQIELVCREFDEPTKIVVFPDGQRGNANSAHVLTKESSLEELKEATRTTSKWYSGYNPSAALPEDKEQLLREWTAHKEKVADITPKKTAKQPDFEELREKIDKTDWTYDFSDDPRVREKGHKQTDETREAIREATRANPQAMEQYLEKLEAEKWRITEAIDQIKYATQMQKEKTKPGLELPLEPKEQSIPWRGREYSKATPLAELQEFDKALREAPKDERLPADEYKRLWGWIGTKQKQDDKMAPRTTPWGDPIQSAKLASGIFEYDAPTHGGVWLNPERNAKVADALKDKTLNQMGHQGWYEHDKDIEIVRNTFPEIFSKRKAQDKPQQGAVADQEKEKEIKGITVKNPDGSYEKLTPASRVEDLIMLRKRVRNGERKVRKEELQALDSWIEEKKKKTPGLDDKSKDTIKPKDQSLVREIQAGIDRTKNLISEMDSKAASLKSRPLPKAPAPGKIAMTVEWADGKSQSFAASNRAEASSLLMSTLDSRGDCSVSSTQRAALANWASNDNPKKSSTMSFQSTPTRTPPKIIPPPDERTTLPVSGRDKKDRGR